MVPYTTQLCFLYLNLPCPVALFLTATLSQSLLSWKGLPLLWLLLAMRCSDVIARPTSKSRRCTGLRAFAAALTATKRSWTAKDRDCIAAGAYTTEHPPRTPARHNMSAAPRTGLLCSAKTPCAALTATPGGRGALHNVAPLLADAEDPPAAACCWQLALPAGVSAIQMKAPRQRFGSLSRHMWPLTMRASPRMRRAGAVIARTLVLIRTGGLEAVSATAPCNMATACDIASLERRRMRPTNGTKKCWRSPSRFERAQHYASVLLHP